MFWQELIFGMTTKTFDLASQAKAKTNQSAEGAGVLGIIRGNKVGESE